MPLPSIDYARASLLKSDGLTLKQIADVMGVNYASLKVGFSRKGLTKSIQVINPDKQDDLAKLSNHVRTRLARHLVKGVEHLDKLPVPSGLKAIQAHAKAISELVPTSVKVFGWDQDNDTKLVSVIMLSSYDPHDPPPVKAIDISSDSVSQGPTQQMPMNTPESPDSAQSKPTV